MDNYPIDKYSKDELVITNAITIDYYYYCKLPYHMTNCCSCFDYWYLSDSFSSKLSYLYSYVHLHFNKAKITIATKVNYCSLDTLLTANNY